MAQAEDRAHRIGQKNSVNIYYLHGKGTLDDEIYSILHEKSLVTTGVTDGRKVDLNLKRTEKQNLDKSGMKDGTMEKPVEEPKRSSSPKETTIDQFFNKRPHLKKLKKQKSELITEEIEEDSSVDDLEIIYDKETYNPKPQQLTSFKFENNPKHSLSALNAPVLSSDQFSSALQSTKNVFNNSFIKKQEKSISKQDSALANVPRQQKLTGMQSFIAAIREDSAFKVPDSKKRQIPFMDSITDLKKPKKL